LNTRATSPSSTSRPSSIPRWRSWSGQRRPRTHRYFHLPATRRDRPEGRTHGPREAADVAAQPPHREPHSSNNEPLTGRRTRSRGARSDRPASPRGTTGMPRERGSAREARRHTGGPISGSPTPTQPPRATQLGGSVVAGPEDAGPFREAVLADPAGATFSVSQRPRALSGRHPRRPPRRLLGLLDCGLRGPPADATVAARAGCVRRPRPRRPRPHGSLPAGARARGGRSAVAPLRRHEHDHARRRVDVGDDEPAPAALLHLSKGSSHLASAPFHATETVGRRLLLCATASALSSALSGLPRSERRRRLRTHGALPLIPQSRSNR
jgi:hypothetical protein